MIIMNSVPTFLPSGEESNAVIPIAAAFQGKGGDSDFVLLLPDGQKQVIPAPLAGVLAIAAQAMMRGYAVSLTVHSGLLTTKQAADMLACSRQHVVKLIDEGKLAAEKMPGGTHRRIKLKDLLDFMRKEDLGRDSLMNEMMSISDDVGGYQEFRAWKKTREAK